MRCFKFCFVKFADVKYEHCKIVKTKRFAFKFKAPNNNLKIR